ncbi:MAG: hypothetical protein ACJ8AS_07510 [Hyphomicrobiales bacterium]
MVTSLRWLIGLALFAAAITTARAKDLGPSFAQFQQSVFLRYLNSDGPQLNGTPQIGLSIGGPLLRATLDSGSTGVVVAATSISNLDQLSSLGEGQLTYTSSGRIMRGRWVLAPVTLTGADGAQLQTEPMPVLAVLKVECLEHARDCEPTDEPRHIAMVGIGFAREHDRQPDSTPEKNPLLRISGGGTEWRHGYVVTATGVQVGLTSANSGGEFQFVKLKRQPDLPDWSAVPACISLNGTIPAACGTMLVDTGVTAMYMTIPAAQAGGATNSLPPGTPVSIAVGTPAESWELYDFETGDEASAVAPDAVHLHVSESRVFVNTSYHFLNGFDFLYDADGGYAGFRRR